MTSVARIRREPCSACPYRLDCPSGLWAEQEYSKLPHYDGETYEQDHHLFMCHATPEWICHGWAVVGGHNSMALRIALAHGRAELEDGDIPPAAVPLFESHTAAALHGLRSIESPTPEAIRTIERLVRKYPHIERP